MMQQRKDKLLMTQFILKKKIDAASWEEVIISSIFADIFFKL